MPVSLASAPATTHGALVPIAYQTISSTTGNFTFSNIPQTYQDLMIVGYARDAFVGSSPFTSQVNFRFNSDSANNYSDTILYGSGSSAVSTRNSSASYTVSAYMVNSGASSSIFGSFTTHILNYANTSTYKTVINRSAADSNGQGWTGLAVNLWRSTSAISSITLYGGSTGFVSGSTFALYGIRSVNQ